MSLFPENQSGIIWTLVCLAVVTFTGVLLSIVADKRFSFTKQRNSLQQDINSNEAKLLEVRAEIKRANTRLAGSESRAAENARHLAATRLTSAELESQIPSRSARRAELSETLAQLETSFGDYRRKYRNHVWRSAAGEHIGNLLTKSGRQYSSVTITAVTSLGLVISHASGNARIDSSELGIEFHDRFQWDQQEREAILARRDEPPTAAPEPVKAVTRPRAARRAKQPVGPDPEVLARYENEVRISRAQMAKARSDHRNALDNSRNSRQRSVPGSLRTWAEQVRILDVLLQRAVARHSLAVENLRSISPDHQLLRVPQTQNEYP